MTLSSEDITAIWLTLKLATVVTLLLIIISTPIAWWLARTKSWLKGPINAIVAMPLVLPPTVLGFYLLIFLGPEGPAGKLLHNLGVSPLPFSFSGLVIASMFYSLPFVVQPIQNAFIAMGDKPLEAAATLRSSPWDRFFHIAIPLAKPGYISAAILGFAHTVGEFGVVLMIGGNISNETRVISIQIYDHVEALEYDQAHALSLLMIGFAFIVLAFLYSSKKQQKNKAMSDGVL
ncbi:molybdate ABC transporter permease subunit [Marinomonas sp. CT5]|uniref:molybdate ABC transporter permease subunit n=1 Tax=Marinomonas sp. CT5 TaxID=2066133 RepID=UPI00180DEB22|nr:molybdate ABC transporter permease subunit [Marinomonas sp. CT5]NVK73144.1 molybdate ABC transporter permease subunit [Oceanospirillaceae bacterium]QUX94826.1 molybdate ABC transporter permease subunit [Marinomonas sp. CT5]